MRDTGWKGLIMDAMLGSIAKRVRLMGVDTLYMRDESDGDIVAIVEETGRWVVTRDKQLAERTSPSSLLLETDDPDEGWDTLLNWLSVMGVKLEPGSRCSVCNTPLVSVEPKTVEHRVPEDVIERGEEVWMCKGCQRVYWKGSHWPRIMEYAPDGY